MISFSKFVSEGVVVDEDGNVTWSDAFSSAPTFVSSRDGEYRNKGGEKKYRSHGTVIRTGGTLQYFYAYSFDSKNPEYSMSSADYAEYLKKSPVEKREFINAQKQKYIRAFKHPTDASLVAVDQLIEKSKGRFEEHLKENGIKSLTDFVIIPIGSSSKLNLHISSIISEWFPGSVVLSNTIVKATNAEVEGEVPADVPGFEKANKLLQSVLKQIKTPVRASELFKLTGTGGIPSNVRAYLKGFFKSAEDKAEQLKSIEGKNVIIIDDTLYEGNSVKDAAREIAKYNPLSINIYVFLDEQRGAGRN